MATTLSQTPAMHTFGSAQPLTSIQQQNASTRPSPSSKYGSYNQQPTTTSGMTTYQPAFQQSSPMVSQTTTSTPTYTSAQPQTYTSTQPQTYTSTQPQTYTSTQPQTYTSTQPQTYTSTQPTTYTSTQPHTYTATSSPNQTQTYTSQLPTYTSTQAQTLQPASGVTYISSSPRGAATTNYGPMYQQWSATGSLPLGMYQPRDTLYVPPGKLPKGGMAPIYDTDKIATFEAPLMVGTPPKSLQETAASVSSQMIQQHRAVPSQQTSMVQKSRQAPSKSGHSRITSQSHMQVANRGMSSSTKQYKASHRHSPGYPTAARKTKNGCGC